MSCFLILSAAWLLDMLVLSQIGPCGRVPVLFTICYVAGFLLMMGMVKTFPLRWQAGQAFALIALLAILGRFFFWGFPVSNDVFRYIWEGFVQIQGFNPYQFAPDNAALAHLIQNEMAVIWQGINHKDLSAAYPPLVMLLFRGLAAISPSTAIFKAAMLVFDFATLAVLVAFVNHRKLPPAWLIWYAANPFVLVYVAGEAHIDIVQAAFLVGALYCLDTQKPIGGFMALGAAAASKYFALMALPFVMKRSNRFAWPGFFLAWLSLVPFAHDPLALFQSLFVFGGQMHYNDGLTEMLRFVFGTATLPVMGLTLAGILSMIYLLEQNTPRSVYLAMGTVLLCLPTLHPWYLVLMAPLMVIYPSRAWLYLMLATAATLPVMAIEYQTGVFQEIKWLKLIEYVPFFCLLAFDTLFRQPQPQRPVYSIPRSVAVIMPVFNESDRIQAAIRSVQQEPHISEIIVVDGESNDGTREKARQTGVKVISGPRGRGCQVNAGVTSAQSDVVLVLHADSSLKKGAVGRMLAALRAYPSIAGGAFEMGFAGRSMKLLFIAWLNNARARWFGIAFGDQGQFVRLAALDRMGGFPDMMLMEDVELSMRLKGSGRPLFVRPGVYVSPRRWENRGFMGNVGMVLKLFVCYLFERRINGPENIRTNYYRKYYGNA